MLFFMQLIFAKCLNKIFCQAQSCANINRNLSDLQTVWFALNNHINVEEYKNDFAILFITTVAFKFYKYDII